MGSIHMSAMRLFESVSEIVGYKSGVALGREAIGEFFRERSG
jgi:hypothetical protein